MKGSEYPLAVGARDIGTSIGRVCIGDVYDSVVLAPEELYTTFLISEVGCEQTHQSHHIFYPLQPDMEAQSWTSKPSVLLHRVKGVSCFRSVWSVYVAAVEVSNGICCSYILTIGPTGPRIRSNGPRYH